MHILITNDDGIDAIGLRALGRAAVERGHRVTVCAPAAQQSAASQHLTISRPLLTRRTAWEGAQAWALEGTPADCARIGLRLAEDGPNGPVQFVMSGINNGLNAGTAVYYSGTFAAAREGAMAYKRAMAVSIDVGATEAMLAHLAQRAVVLAEELAEADFPRGEVLNLNAPAIEPEKLKELTVCPLSEAFFLDEYERRESPRGQVYFWLSDGLKMEPHPQGSDLDLLEKGYMTLSAVGGFQSGNWLQSCASFQLRQ